MHGLAIRILEASRLVDRLLQLVIRAREVLVLGLANDSFLAAYGNYAYGGKPSYQPNQAAFRDALFKEEEQALTAEFPPAPAHILVGAAGGGREALALAARGYQVTAFEPAPLLAKALAQRAAATQAAVTVYCGRYEDLWSHKRDLVHGLNPLPTPSALGRFDAVILGWGGFSHLFHDEDRHQLLSTCTQLIQLNAPIMLSFLYVPRNRSLDRNRGRLSRIAQKFLARNHRKPGDRFYPGMGFIHEFAPGELQELAAGAGLQVAFTTQAEKPDKEMKMSYPIVILRSEPALTSYKNN